MSEHPLAKIICIMSGVFGAIFIVAFLFQFDPTVLAGAKVDEAPPKGKAGAWLDLLLSMTGRSGASLRWEDYRRAWDETKGTRFLIPLGVALCAMSYLVYRLWL